MIKKLLTDTVSWGCGMLLVAMILYSWNIPFDTALRASISGLIVLFVISELMEFKHKVVWEAKKRGDIKVPSLANKFEEKER